MEKEKGLFGNIRGKTPKCGTLHGKSWRPRKRLPGIRFFRCRLLRAPEIYVRNRAKNRWILQKQAQKSRPPRCGRVRKGHFSFHFLQQQCSVYRWCWCHRSARCAAGSKAACSPPRLLAPKAGGWVGRVEFALWGFPFGLVGKREKVCLIVAWF
jgi:hypothetical protein